MAATVATPTISLARRATIARDIKHHRRDLAYLRWQLEADENGKSDDPALLAGERLQQVERLLDAAINELEW